MLSCSFKHKPWLNLLIAATLMPLVLIACGDSTTSPTLTATGLPAASITVSVTSSTTEPTNLASATVRVEVTVTPTLLAAKPTPTDTENSVQQGTVLAVPTQAPIETKAPIPPATTTLVAIPRATPVAATATFTPRVTGAKTPTATGGEPGTLKGRITAGPTCPVERPDKPCPPAPVANQALQVRDQSSNTIILSLTTDSQGYFIGQLTAGQYQVVVISNKPYPRDRSASHPIAVTAGQITNLEIQLDTGLR